MRRIGASGLWVNRQVYFTSDFEQKKWSENATQTPPLSLSLWVGRGEERGRDEIEVAWMNYMDEIDGEISEQPDNITVDPDYNPEK